MRGQPSLYSIAIIYSLISFQDPRGCVTSYDVLYGSCMKCRNFLDNAVSVLREYQSFNAEMAAMTHVTVRPGPYLSTYTSRRLFSAAAQKVVK